MILTSFGELTKFFQILVPKCDAFKGLSDADAVHFFKQHIVRLEETDGEIGYWNLNGNVSSILRFNGIAISA